MRHSDLQQISLQVRLKLTSLPVWPFKVSSGIDSKTILDRTGAQQLIGRGDMLFLSGNEPVRVQCAFVDTPEVERINEFIASQQGYYFCI